MKKQDGRVLRERKKKEESNSEVPFKREGRESRERKREGGESGRINSSEKLYMILFHR